MMNKEKKIEALKRYAAEVEEAAKRAEDRAVYWGTVMEDVRLKSVAQKEAKKSKKIANSCYEKIAELEQKEEDEQRPQIGDIWEYSFDPIHYKRVIFVAGSTVVSFKYPKGGSEESKCWNCVVDHLDVFAHENHILIHRPGLGIGQGVRIKDSGVITKVCNRLTDSDDYQLYGQYRTFHRSELEPIELSKKVQRIHYS